MMVWTVSKSLAGAALLAFAVAPALAQPDLFAELDALSDASADEATGVKFATEQAGRGEYLEALATLERVMAAFPKSTDARLLHAIYLCRIDDKQGGLAEIDEMKEKVFGKELLEQAKQICVAPPPPPVEGAAPESASAAGETEQ